MTIALIVAAGSGARLGAARPKAFVELEGRTLLQWSVDALTRTRSVQEIVVALPEGEQAPPGTRGARGGDTRSESVRAALGAAGADGDPVLVHDAARPLITPELAEAVIEAAQRPGAAAAVAASPVTDTIKRAQAAPGALPVVQSTLSRDGLWAVQTPQVFRRAALEEALRQPREQLRAASDDASLVEAMGGRVLVVPCTAENIKITTPTDLLLAGLLLRGRSA